MTSLPDSAHSRKPRSWSAAHAHAASEFCSTSKYMHSLITFGRRQPFLPMSHLCICVFLLKFVFCGRSFASGMAAATTVKAQRAKRESMPLFLF